MIATGGGALSLIISGLTHARETILAAAGMIIAVICWIITYKRYKITQDLIDSL
jgi:tetrahydromethanopterin S-methyltransferase subunit C